MKFLVQGGQSLRGEINLAGAKNAATKMLIASLLTEEESVLENFPQIGDTALTFELCKELGSDFSISNSTLRIKTPKIKTSRVTALHRKNRIPILALGPLLSRTGEAEVPILGGDKIGPRPVDIHLESLRKLGAKIEIGKDFYRASAPDGLRGAEINFRYPSVGATENTILASVLAKGKTVINNAATEPEIIDLIKMLQKMGAVIELGADRRIIVYGVSRLFGAEHNILPDRNEAVSFACLAIALGGEIFVRGAVQEHLITFLNALRRVGAEYVVDSKGITFRRKGDLKGIEIETDTHPGFMTDWQQPFMVVLTQSQGESKVHETVYEDRFGYVEDLNLMGANIKVVRDCLGDLDCRFKGKNIPHGAIVSGSTRLRGASLRVPDLRAGIAHLIAALVADGESVIDNVEEIDRGYEKIDERLKELGANIKRVTN